MPSNIYSQVLVWTHKLIPQVARAKAKKLAATLAKKARRQQRAEEGGA